MAGSLFRSTPSVEDCVLTRQEFYKVCMLTQDGEQQSLEQFVEQVLSSRRCRIGRNTFCPNERSSSTFVLAAQNGRVDVLKYLLKVSPTVDPNHLAKAYFYRGGQTHICTALYAACRQGYLHVVQELLAAGSSVDLQCSCCNETPLRVAVSYGFVDIAALLLAEGASTKTADTRKNWTPLMAAVFHGHAGLVSLLLENGADPHLQNLCGYTAVHVAVVLGLDSVIAAFVSQGVSPVIHASNFPLALFVAAAIGHRDIVSTLLTHPDCSPKMRADAIKILGPPWLEPLFLNPSGSNPCTTGNVSSGLQTRDTTDPRVDLSLCSMKLSITDVYQQTMALQELVGQEDLINALFQRGVTMYERKCYTAAETLWIRLTKLMANVLGLKNGVTRDIVSFTMYVCPAVEEMVANRYEPCFSIYVTFIIDILKKTYLDDRKTQLLNSALKLMSTWLHYDCNYQLKQSTFDYDVAVGSDECEKQGCHLVQQNLYPYSVRKSLLITALETLDSTVITPPFVHTLLRWGADLAVNSATIGERPLHYAAKLNPSLIPVFLAHGAHLDAVDSSGRTPYAVAILQEAKNALAPGNPPPLICLASRAIVFHGIPYYADQRILPHNLITFIKLHDQRFVNDY